MFEFSLLEDVSESFSFFRESLVKPEPFFLRYDSGDFLKIFLSKIYFIGKI